MPSPNFPLVQGIAQARASPAHRPTPLPTGDAARAEDMAASLEGLQRAETAGMVPSGLPPLPQHPTMQAAEPCAEGSSVGGGAGYSADPAGTEEQER